MRKIKAPVKKHPDGIAWENWCKENKDALDRSTIGPTNEYIENRLWLAFMDGVEHGRKTPDVHD